MSEKIKPEIITVDGKEYELDKLSENAINQLKGIELANNEMIRLNGLAALAETARNAYVSALSADLEEDTKNTSNS